jgi:hypothetical protein
MLLCCFRTLHFSIRPLLSENIFFCLLFNFLLGQFRPFLSKCYITFPGYKFRQNDCRMWNISYKYNKKHMYSTTEMFTQESTVVTYEAIQKCIHIYIHQYCQLNAIYTAFKLTSILDNKESASEQNECVFTYSLVIF